MKKLILIAIMLCLVFAWGLLQERSRPNLKWWWSKKKKLLSKKKSFEPVVDPMAVYKAEYDALPVTHTVTKGECLWWISEYKHVYNDPFMWPLIFKANRDKINNPDLIYPGQQFDVPRYGFDLEEVKASRKEAGAPWKALEPGQDAMIPAEMRAALGYSF